MFSVLHDDRHIHLAVVRHPVSDVMYATQSVTTSERVLRHPCLMTTVYFRWVQTGHDVKESKRHFKFSEEALPVFISEEGREDVSKDFL